MFTKTTALILAMTASVFAPATAFGTIISKPPETKQQTVIIERNNNIAQNIEQNQEACTNELDVEASESDKGDQEVEVDSDQSNECIVFQEQNAVQNAFIFDDSINFLAGLNLDLIFGPPAPPGEGPVWCYPGGEGSLVCFETEGACDAASEACQEYPTRPPGCGPTEVPGAICETPSQV